MDFEKNSPHQKGMTSKMYQRPDKSYFQELLELQSQVDTGKLVQMVLPKQADIDKVLKIIERKCLKGNTFTYYCKKTQTGYLISPYFKDIYLSYMPIIKK